MDTRCFGLAGLSWGFLGALLDIILINLVLSGDNAVVIAMAVKSLPREKRLFGIAVGSGAAVLLRLGCTLVVARLLLLEYVKLVGGALILWVAVKLLTEGAGEGGVGQEPKGLLHAFWIILVADVSMSVDNILAVGAASHGSPFLLLFGLGLSIPIVVFASSLLALLMDRYPLLVYLGTAILGRVGGEMIITDPWVHGLVNPSRIVEYVVQALFTTGVVAAGMLILRRREKPCLAPERERTE